MFVEYLTSFFHSRLCSLSWELDTAGVAISNPNLLIIDESTRSTVEDIEGVVIDSDKTTFNIAYNQGAFPASRYWLQLYATINNVYVLLYEGVMYINDNYTIEQQSTDTLFVDSSFVFTKLAQTTSAETGGNSIINAMPIATKTQYGLTIFTTDDEVESQIEDKSTSPANLIKYYDKPRVQLAYSQTDIELIGKKPCFVELFEQNNVPYFKKSVTRIDGAVIDNTQADSLAQVFLVGRAILENIPELTIIGERYMYNLSTGAIVVFDQANSSGYKYIGLCTDTGRLKFDEDFPLGGTGASNVMVIQETVYTKMPILQTVTVLQDTVYAKMPTAAGQVNILQNTVYAKMPTAVYVPPISNKIAYHFPFFYDQTGINKMAQVKYTYPNMRVIVLIEASWKVSITGFDNNNQPIYDFSSIGENINRVVQAGCEPAILIQYRIWDSWQKKASTYMNEDRVHYAGGGYGDAISFTSGRLENAYSWVQLLMNYIANHQYANKIHHIKFDNSDTAEYGFPINSSIINAGGTYADVHDIPAFQQYLANKYNGWTTGQTNKSLSSNTPYGIASGVSAPWKGITNTGVAPDGSVLGNDWFDFRNNLLSITAYRIGSIIKNKGFKLVIDNGSFTDSDYHRNAWAMPALDYGYTVDWFKHNPGWNYRQTVQNKVSKFVEWTWIDEATNTYPNGDPSARQNFVNKTKKSFDDGVEIVSFSFFASSTTWNDLDIMLQTLNNDGYLDRSIRTINSTHSVPLNVSYALSNGGYDSKNTEIENLIQSYGTENVTAQIVNDRPNYKFLDSPYNTNI